MKRKLSNSPKNTPQKPSASLDDPVSSDSDSDNPFATSHQQDDDSDSDVEQRETAEHKKLRLAKEYVKEVEKSVRNSAALTMSDSDSDSESNSDSDSAFVDQAHQISNAMVKNRQKLQGKHMSNVARSIYEVSERSENLAGNTSTSTNNPLSLARSAQSVKARECDATLEYSPCVTLLKSHYLPVTCCTLVDASSDEIDGEENESGPLHAFSGSKDNSIYHYDVSSEKKIREIVPIFKGGYKNSSAAKSDGEVLTLKGIWNGNGLVSGCRDGIVRVYDVRIGGQSGEVYNSNSGSSIPINSNSNANSNNESNTNSNTNSNFNSNTNSNTNSNSNSNSNSNNNSIPPPQLLKGHKGAITGLCTRFNTSELYSCSEDRCVRRWDFGNWISAMSSVSQAQPDQDNSTNNKSITVGSCTSTTTSTNISYIETLYGHQAAVTAIDCYYTPSIVTVGRDRTARLWKVNEDSHFIYRNGAKAHASGCVSSINNEWFLTGGEDGSVGLWYNEKKKAVSSIAHGHNGVGGIGVVSVSSLKGSDFAMSGSNDGKVNLWKVKTGKTNDDRGLELYEDASIRCKGYVNEICIGRRGRVAVAALGQEHKLGRWDVVSGGVKLNRFAIMKL